MKIKVKQIILLVTTFILLFGFNLLKAHNRNNGGCGNHCKSDQFNIIEETSEFINIELDNKIKYSSCLNKSLCRG